LLCAVASAAPALAGRAQALAAALGLPLTTLGDQRFAFLLTITTSRLELRQQGTDAPGPIYVDFVGGRLGYRRRHGGGRGQALARAIGLKGGAGTTPLRVLDATAGLGRDAFVLATLGANVHMIERSAIVAALLQDGLARASADATVGPLVTGRLQLTVADARLLLPTLSADQQPDVIYLDPMYPERHTAALVKKESRALRRLVGADPDAAELLAAALAHRPRRVVVKRPRSAPFLAGFEPSLQLESKTTRYDVYLP
jgi:16S rRNA (guanine1516-N2)-methyltransferase